MRVYPITDIAQDVRTALDQNMISRSLEEIGDVDTLSLNEVIRSKMLDGVKRIHSDAPAYLLDGGHTFGEEVFWKDRQSGWVLLPEDFLRFVVFQMNDWERAVYEAITVDDAEYALQSSRYKGLRGTSQKPVCAIAIRPEGRVMEFYSCKSNDAKVSRALYLPYPKIDLKGGIEICERCYESVVYTIASLVLTAYGDTDKSALMTDEAQKTMK